MGFYIYLIILRFKATPALLLLQGLCLDSLGTSTHGCKNSRIWGGGQLVTWQGHLHSPWQSWGLMTRLANPCLWLSGWHQATGVSDCFCHSSLPDRPISPDLISLEFFFSPFRSRSHVRREILQEQKLDSHRTTREGTWANGNVAPGTGRGVLLHSPTLDDENMNTS